MLDQIKLKEWRLIFFDDYIFSMSDVEGAVYAPLWNSGVLLAVQVEDSIL